MRFCLLFFMMSLFVLAAQPGAAQNKDAEEKAKRIAAIQREIETVFKELAQLRGEERREYPPESKLKAPFEKKLQELHIRLAMLRLELALLQPVVEPKTGVSVSCSLQITPVRGRMIPKATGPYRDGATVRILAAKDKKILAEGKTDPFGSLFLAVPPGKYLVLVSPRSNVDTLAFGEPTEVAVEKDRVTHVAVIIRGVSLR